MSALTDVYCDWFEGLAPEVGKDLALRLMRLFPGGLLEPTLTTSDITAGFVPRVRRLAGRTAHSDAGHTLTLCALTDFIFAERGDPAQWAEDRAKLEVLDQAREVLGDAMDADVAEWVNEHRLRYPLRAKQWEKAAESWRSLRDGPLTSDRIRAALQIPRAD